MSALRETGSEICPKAVRRGTHRIATPEATLERVRPLASHFGITRLGNVTGLDCIGIPVAVAVRPNSKSFSAAQGKGVTLAHAYASALMEAVEIFHAEQIAASVTRATAHEIPLQGRLDLEALPRTGKPLGEETSLDWIEGYDLLNDVICMVPTEIVDSDATLPRKPARGYFLAGTNGLASGNHYLEAISAAICELVERDAVALWNASSIRARRPVDLASIDDCDAMLMLERYRAAGMMVRIFDATSDVGLATFICDIGDPRTYSNVLPRCRGAGCHPDRSVALLRALTEAAQVRLTHIAGTRDDIGAAEYARSPLQELGIALIDAASKSEGRTSLANAPTFDGATVNDDVEWELACLRRAGVERAIAVDLMRPEFGIPVVRVIVPGLEWDSNDPAYAPRSRALRAAGKPG